MARVFIGVAWPYSNGPFHIGHLAGAYLPGDIFARFHRLRGNDVLMVSGSDMHGTPTLVRAEAERTTAEAVARRYDAINRAAFERLGFTFDLFTHTHTIVHERTVQEVFLTLLTHGYIRRRTEENPYCPTHRRFLPDRYLEGECPHCHFPNARGDECDNCGRVLVPTELLHPRCRLDGTPAEFRPSEHFYLELDKLGPRLERYLAEKSFWRPTVLGVARNFLREGLHPTPITRDLEWGVPLPLDGYPTKRFYVWFEAVIGYLSASKEWAIRAGRPDAWRKFWDPREQVRQYYFVGKDNVFHHAIVWPGILLGHEDLALPYDVPANQWLLVEGGKISKSRSSTGDTTLPSLLEEYAPDMLRFYAAQQAPQNHDTEFRWEEFHQLTEDVLSNQYGNLVQRLLVLTRDRYHGRIPEPPEGVRGPESPAAGRIGAIHAAITAEYEAVHLKEALERGLAAVREENRRVHEARPWQSSDEARRATLWEGLWLLKAAAIWLAPVLPFSSTEVFRMLGFSEPPGHGDWEDARVPPPTGQALGSLRPLFPRAEERRREPPSEPVPTPPSDVPFGIRAARILEVADHPSADRLYVLTVDAGEPEARTVVAGMKGSYPPEEIRGRSVALLANLAPRTIRRVTSQGMVLAADVDGRARLVEPPDGVRPGTNIVGVGSEPRTIAYEEFERFPLVVGRVREESLDESLVEVGGRTVRVPGPWPPGASVVVRLAGQNGNSGEVLSFGAGLPLRPSGEVPTGSRVR